MEINRPTVAELMADVAAAVARRGAAVSEDVYEAILQDIPQPAAGHAHDPRERAH